MRNQVYICGTGNVAASLLRELIKHHIDVTGVFSRSQTKILGRNTISYGTHFPELDSVVFLAVPDRAITETENLLGNGNYFAVHHAGSVSMESLQSKRKGVFYPLQSFTHGADISWQGIPVLIESNDEFLLESLFELAAAFGTNPVEINSEQREVIHLAAVFANNFSNAMFDIAQELVVNAGVNPALLTPLIRETTAKIERMRAKDAQTGPARRGDANTIDEHIKLISDNESAANIYKAVTHYLIKRHSTN